MKLAVEAPTQVEGSDAMNVEIVPTLRTPCSRYQKYGNNEDNQPDAKNNSCFPIRMSQS